MAKYWYRIRLARVPKAEELEDLKSELVRLFQTTEAPEVNGDNFNVTTPLEPQAAGQALDRFCIKHCAAAFVAGGKLGEP
jgi:hypothetical protein